MKNIFMLVGERSADVHAAEVIKQLKQKNPSLNIWGIGGPLMQKQEFESIFPFSKFSIIGFAEVLGHLGFILQVFRTIKSKFNARKPDLAILVDYPGMNIRVARICHAFGIPVLYYISPQVWAWKKKRIHKIAEYSDKIAVIFPFEKKLYEEVGADVEYVGHPISEEIAISQTKEEFAEKYSLNPDKEWIGFIPGSRNVEIKRILPEIVEAITNLKNIYNDFYQFLISQADSVSDELFQKVISPVTNDVTIIHDTHPLMKYCKVIVCKSGTSTLETGYLGTPMVVVYKTSSLSYFIAKAFIKIKMIALANIVIGKKLVPELIQHTASAENILKEVCSFIDDDDYYQTTKNELLVIKNKLGRFDTSKKVAEIALLMINET